MDKKPKALNVDETMNSPIDNLAGFVTFTNKFTNRIESAIVDSGLSLSDWLVLQTINVDGSGTISDLAKKLGVSRQRIHQQANLLKSQELADITPNSDGKTKNISLTKKGTGSLVKVNDTLMSLFSSVNDFKGKIETARKSASRIARSLAPSTPTST
jgi:DNA-binding MarR family transcriptional regulator